MERVIAMFVGPEAGESEVGAVSRAVERLPEGAVVLDRDGGGVEVAARSVAQEAGVHVGTLRRSPAAPVSEAAREAAILRLRPTVVFAARRADEATSRFVAMARAVGAEVRPLGPGEGASWSGAKLSRAEAAELRRVTARVAVSIFAGSREWEELGVLEGDVRSLPDGALVIEGDARGLDRYAGAMGRMMGHPVLSVPALWDFFGAPGERGNPAGYKRNEAMASLGADRLFAYPLDGPGTGHMIERAEECAISVVEARKPCGFLGRVARVVHCEEESYDTYIGRGRDPRTSEIVGLGNQWSHRPSQVPGVIETLTPEESVVLYRRWLSGALRSGRMPEARIEALHATTLGCWCRRGSACHGHALGRAAAFLYFGGSFDG